jgi:hypothetical protein
MRKRIGIILVCIIFIGFAIPQNGFTDQMRADPGDVILSFDSPGSMPAGLAWDGQYLWNIDLLDNEINKLTTSGDIVDSVEGPGVNIIGLTWDGSYFWTGDDGVLKIYKLTTSGEIVDSFDSPGTVPWGFAWDGEYLWNSDWDADKIYKLSTSGEIIDSFDSPGVAPTGLAWDGKYLWNSDWESKKIYELDPLDGRIISYFNAPGETPAGLTWDGQYLWSTDLDLAKIYKLDAGGSGGEPDIVIDEITGGFGISISIVNIGLESAYDVNWSIKVEPSIGFILSGSHTEDMIDELAVGGSVTIQSNNLRGIGLITITIQVGDAEKQATTFLLGPLVLRVK